MAVVVIGASFCDVVCGPVHTNPRFGEDVVSEEAFSLLPGGSALNTSMQLSSLLDNHKDHGVIEGREESGFPSSACIPCLSGYDRVSKVIHSVGTWPAEGGEDERSRGPEHFGKATSSPASTNVKVSSPIHLYSLIADDIQGRILLNSIRSSERIELRLPVERAQRSEDEDEDEFFGQLTVSLSQTDSSTPLHTQTPTVSLPNSPRTTHKTRSKRPRLGTGTCLVIRGERDRAFVTYRGLTSELSTERHLHADKLRGARHIHIAGFYNCPSLWQGLPSLLKRLRDRGTSEETYKEAQITKDYVSDALTEPEAKLVTQKRSVAGPEDNRQDWDKSDSLPCGLQRDRPLVSLTPQFDATERWQGGLQLGGDLLRCIDILILNEVEARALVGGDLDVRECGRRLATAMADEVLDHELLRERKGEMQTDKAEYDQAKESKSEGQISHAKSTRDKATRKDRAAGAKCARQDVIGRAGMQQRQQECVRREKLCVVTLGPAGCFVSSSNGSEASLKAAEVPVKDTTGAGDAFAAGLIYGLLTHPKERLSFFSRVQKSAVERAALCRQCQSLGRSMEPALSRSPSLNVDGDRELTRSKIVGSKCFKNEHTKELRDLAGSVREVCVERKHSKPPAPLGGLVEPQRSMDRSSEAQFEVNTANKPSLSYDGSKKETQTLEKSPERWRKDSDCSMKPEVEGSAQVDLPMRALHWALACGSAVVTVTGASCPPPSGVTTSLLAKVRRLNA